MAITHPKLEHIHELQNRVTCCDVTNRVTNFYNILTRDMKVIKQIWFITSLLEIIISFKICELITRKVQIFCFFGQLVGELVKYKFSNLGKSWSIVSKLFKNHRSPKVSSQMWAGIKTYIAESVFWLYVRWHKYEFIKRIIKN